MTWQWQVIFKRSKRDKEYVGKNPARFYGFLRQRWLHWNNVHATHICSIISSLAVLAKSHRCPCSRLKFVFKILLGQFYTLQLCLCNRSSAYLITVYTVVLRLALILTHIFQTDLFCYILLALVSEQFPTSADSATYSFIFEILNFVFFNGGAGYL